MSSSIPPSGAPAPESRIPARRARPATQMSPSSLAVLGTAMIILGLILCGLWGYMILSVPRLAVGPTPTWTVVISTNVPETPTLAATIPITPVLETTPEPGATVAVTTTVPAGEFAVGAKVQVSGTGGSGLSLRQEPSTSSPRLAVALEGEQLEITDGPRQVADFTWWKLRRTDGTEGWGVQSFLQVVR